MLKKLSISFLFIISSCSSINTTSKNSLDLSSLIKEKPLPKMEIKESSGNGDDIPNKGETLDITPYFKSFITSKDSQNIVKVSSKSSFATINDYYDSFHISKDGSFFKANSPFKVTIDKSTPSGTEIVFVFKLKDGFDNEFETQEKIKIEEIDNKISFSKMEIKESSGNGDDIPNKGETLDFIAYFTNTGVSSTNRMNVKVSSKSSFVTINDYYDSTSINEIKPKIVKETNSNFKVTIDKSTPSNTEIPLTFKLKDDFGNEFETTASFKIEEIDNKISFSKIEIKESDGNGDDIPNRGETLDLIAYFTNTGASSTNRMNVKVSSKSSFVTINDYYDSTSINEIKPKIVKETNSNFKVTIDKSTPSNTEIPLIFKLKDDFGNEFETTASFKVR